MSMQVLVVEDEESIRRVVVQALRHQGYDVEAAEGGQQALDRLLVCDYDCVVLDLRMPGMGGLQVYQILKQSRPGLARRVIFCTGETAAPSLLWFLKWTGNRLLPKPFRMNQLLEMCDEVCRLEE